MNLFLTLSFAIQLLIFFLSIRLLRKNIMDFCGIFIVLFLVFFAFPAWDFILGGRFFGNEIVGFIIQDNYSDNVYKLFFLSNLTAMFFSLGYIFVENRKKNERYSMKTILSLNNIIFLKNRYYLTITIAVLLWLVVFFISFRNYGYNLVLFFSPSRKDSVFESTYISFFYKNIPIFIFFAKVIRDYLYRGKVTFSCLVLFLFPLLTSLTSGQRREIINFIILSVVFLIQLRESQLSSNELIKTKSHYTRKRIFLLGIFGVVLIPVLWWSRVFFTQIQRNDSVRINPLELRGIGELIFGSSSGGFLTLLLGDLHQKTFEIPYFYSLVFLITSFIPRSLFANKPLILNRLWQIDFNLTGNPSLFFINETIINFGAFSFLFSFLVGSVLSLLTSKLDFSKRIDFRIVSIIILSNSITFFKNGYTQFFINVVMAVLTIVIPLKIFIKQRGKL